MTLAPIIDAPPVIGFHAFFASAIGGRTMNKATPGG
jgi:hypothetical protein